MRRQALIVLSSAGLSLLSWAAPGVLAADAEQKGKIDAVTVYQGQALVTRLLEAPGQAGLKEIVVTDLPEQVVAGSIYAEADAGVEVRSVSFRARPVEKDVREEVRKLDEQIRATQDSIADAQARIKVVHDQRAFLTALQGFVAPTASVEMTKGVLNAETLAKVTQMQMEQRTKLTLEELELGKAIRGFNERLANLQNQRNQLSTSSSRQAREAVVFINVTKPGTPVRLRYLVNGASWSPSYNVRVAGNREALAVEYLASVHQKSGEDWPGVSMTLSTAMPHMIAMAPRFRKLELTLARADQVKPDTSQPLSYADLQREANQRRTSEWRDLANAQAIFKNDRAAASNNIYDTNAAFGANPQDSDVKSLWTSQNRDWGGNIAWGDNHAEFLQGSELTRQIRYASKTTTDDNAFKTPMNETIVVTYKLDNRTALPSRPDHQLIPIATLPLKAEFYKVASPLLSPYVYDEALAVNASQLVLLTGPYSSYVDNQFVGQGVMPTVTIGDSCTVGLGIDSSLRAGRELVEKTDTTQGGNRVGDFTYRLTLDNFGVKPAKVRLMDRLPVAKETEIKITLIVPGKEISKDPVFEKDERKKGILRWDIEAPANGFGPKATSFEFQYRVEHDKQMVLTRPGGEATDGASKMKR